MNRWYGRNRYCNNGCYNHTCCKQTCDCCCCCCCEKIGPVGPVGPSGEPGDPGTAGITPHIGENGNWIIGDIDTGVAAQGIPGADGQDGADGITPNIGENGNWYIGDVDTGIAAQGPQGEDGQNGQNGLTPYIGNNGNWYIGDTDTGIAAQGPRGEVGPAGSTSLIGLQRQCRDSGGAIINGEIPFDRTIVDTTEGVITYNERYFYFNQPGIYKVDYEISHSGSAEPGIEIVFAANDGPYCQASYPTPEGQISGTLLFDTSPYSGTPSIPCTLRTQYNIELAAVAVQANIVIVKIA